MASGNFINVVGTVNLTKKTGKILYVNPVSSILVAKAGDEGQLLIRVKSADGQLLQEHPTRVKLDTCSDRGAERTGIFDTAIPANPEARVLELLIEGQVVDTYGAAAAPPPEVSNIQRIGITDEAINFAWDAPAPAPSGVIYNVQVSTDEGHTWQTVAVGRTSPDAAIDRTQFPPGTKFTVRVVATDGFTSRVVTSDTFTSDEPES
jgi:hypothetical protein